jgi:uncharacterized protein (DUF58 family)
MKEVSAYRYLTRQMVERLRGLDLAVKRSMDGHRQGTHQSPAFGSSVEFAEYREYQPGDPIHQIDWPVFARTDRYMIRRYHEDVSIRCCLLLDTSESMAYQQDGKLTKLEYACFLAAGMMYLMTQQGDTVSLLTFSDGMRECYEPAGSFVGLRPMLLALEALEPKGKGNIESSLHACAEFIKGKTLVVVLSDLLTDPEAVLRALTHLHQDGKDITVFHVLDPAEIRLPDAGLVDVTALEGEGRITVDWGQIGQAYLSQVHQYLEALRTGCQHLRADYFLSQTTDDPADVIGQRSRAV